VSARASTAGYRQADQRSASSLHCLVHAWISSCSVCREVTCRRIGDDHLPPYRPPATLAPIRARHGFSAV